MTTSPAKPRRRTQRERVEESSQRLLEAAVDVIAEKGFDRATTAEISKRAGMSNSMVHIRYGSKEALLEALLRSYETRMFESNAAPDSDGRHRVLGQVEAVRTQLTQDPRLLRAFFMIQFEVPSTVPHLKPWLIDWLERYVGHIAESIGEGQTDGSIRPDLDPETEARSFLTIGIGLGFRWILNSSDTHLRADLTDWHRRTNDRLEPRSDRLARPAR